MKIVIQKKISKVKIIICIFLLLAIFTSIFVLLNEDRWEAKSYLENFENNYKQAQNIVFTYHYVDKENNIDEQLTLKKNNKIEFKNTATLTKFNKANTDNEIDYLSYDEAYYAILDTLEKLKIDLDDTRNIIEKKDKGISITFDTYSFENEEYLGKQIYAFINDYKTLRITHLDENNNPFLSFTVEIS